MKAGRRVWGGLGVALAVLLSGQVCAQTAPAAQVTVHADRPGALIHPEIYGQFAEQLGHGIYGGIWVGEHSSIPNIRGYRKDVVEALKAIKVPVIRWPGGCFADQYDWRDGIGPRNQRPVRMNASWGGEDDNQFGTQEFMDFAELIGAKTYLSINVGTGSPREMSQWIEYITADGHSSLAQQRRANGRAQPWKLDYVGIGNEMWGCGGSMRASFYADVYRQYATFVHAPPNAPITRVASGANADDVAWTDTVMAAAGSQIDAISLHNYTIPTGNWEHKGSATQFGEAQWMSTLQGALHMDDLIARHSAVMDKYDPHKRVALAVDEWGNWMDQDPSAPDAALYQQNSLRDALSAAVTLDIFQAHADRVRMANIAQMVNVLQAMILTDQSRMVLTPTYYVFDLYQVFQGATYLPIDVQAPAYRYADASVPGIHATAGRDRAGVVHVALVNLDPHQATTVRIRLDGVQGTKVQGRMLTAPQITSINSFEHPHAVEPVAFEHAVLKDGVITAALPAKSVTVLDIR
ncbi:alpha-N-arabinofuranosidase [Dyella acidiphila]|uniref:non-reducing end alpha-L-arabinofuranosidase n=1 Tax=Dyella acidiphila TaxID=2775866 RepID=A0ABR9G9G6_9GAMM|nr:alpha-L-arabinofuranosidase C-terminal domain-containing protein [Dyella acidiphila]MBE1160666.1 alpha-N-arabinofuranosidase [Dyella acidiphila]